MHLSLSPHLTSFRHVCPAATSCQLPTPPEQIGLFFSQHVDYQIKHLEDRFAFKMKHTSDSVSQVIFDRMSQTLCATSNTERKKEKLANRK